MDFGICLPNFGPSADTATLRDLARHAEARGFRALWLTDHVLVPRELASPYEHIYEILTTLAYLAGVTERIALATSIVVLPQRDPIVVAKQVATIDQLSGGRVWLGVGIGWMEREFAFLRTPFHRRGRLTDEWIAVMQALWRGESTFAGETIRFDNAAFSPLPVQPGGPLLYIAGASPAALARAARVGRGWHPVNATPDAIRDGVAQLRALTDRRLHITNRLRVNVGAPPPAGGARPPVRLVGPVEVVRAGLRAYADAGLDQLVAVFDMDSAESFRAQMDRFADAFLPEFS